MFRTSFLDLLSNAVSAYALSLVTIIFSLTKRSWIEAVVVFNSIQITRLACAEVILT